MNPGIDYGNGLTNIDSITGIRYGVLPVNDVSQAWYDSEEPDYGKPCCPDCGSELETYDDEKHGDWIAMRPSYRSCAEYVCDHCQHYMEACDAYPDEPFAHILDDGEYLAQQTDHDIMILKSPYYTHAQFCSPCVPGAGYLANPCPSGPKTYCFGPDWFDEEYPCPYPIYRVDNSECIYTPNDAE
jgi:ribosomal protein L37AE/L43A